MSKLLRVKDFPNEYTEEVLNYLRVLSLSNLKNTYIIGSAGIRSQTYIGDYDVDEYVKLGPSLYSDFSDMIKKASNTKDLFIIEITLGVIDKEKVRWTIEEVIKGFKMVNNVKYTIEDGFKSSNAKVDTIALVQKVIHTEINVVYKVVKEESSKLDIKEIEEQLKQSLYEYVKEKNYYKMAKRMYAIARLNKDYKTLEKLTEMFNGDLGRIYSLLNESITLITLLENNKSLDLDKIKYEIDNFRYRINNVYTVESFYRKRNKLSSKIKKMITLPNTKSSREELIKDLKSLEKFFYDVLQKNTLTQMKKLKLYPIPKKFVL